MKSTLKTVLITVLGLGIGGLGWLALAHGPALADLADAGMLLADSDDDDDDDDDDDEATLPLALLNRTIPVQAAAETALAEAAGELQSIELEQEDGQLVYVVELTTAEVLIDAQTGDVLEVEAELEGLALCRGQALAVLQRYLACPRQQQQGVTPAAAPTPPTTAPSGPAIPG